MNIFTSEAKPAKMGLHFFYSVVIAYSKLDYSVRHASDITLSVSR